MKLSRMKALGRLAALTALLAASGSVSAQQSGPGSLAAYGNFRQMMHRGETAGVIALDSLVPGSGSWGVGALAGLRGEVLIHDGRVLVSRGDDPKALATPPRPGEQAVILAFGIVRAWRDVTVPRDMDGEALARFVAEEAGRAGLDVAAGFPIRVTGRFPHLLWHVVTGNPPAPGADSHAGAHGGGHAGGHANSRSGMTFYRQPGASGEIVGVFAGPALEGVATHPGERLHLHFIDEAMTVSGHVDRVTVPAGAILKLPVP